MNSNKKTSRKLRLTPSVGPFWFAWNTKWFDGRTKFILYRYTWSTDNDLTLDRGPNLSLMRPAADSINQLKIEISLMGEHLWTIKKRFRDQFSSYNLIPHEFVNMKRYKASKMFENII